MSRLIGFLCPELTHSTLAASGVPDIDITLDDNGPGAAQIAEIYDPVMEDLGFTNSGNTGSDPGDPGGPNSVNHVYSPDDSQQTINGVAGELPNIKIWSDEDITAGSFSDDREVQGGYKFQYDFRAPQDAGTPIPLLAAFEQLIPLPGTTGAERLVVRLESRAPDSFRAEEGLNYLALQLAWLIPGERHDEALAFYRDQSMFADETVLLAGQPNSDRTGIERTELEEFGETTHRLRTTLLQRWEGIMSIDRDANDAGDTRIEYRVEINPLVGPLATIEG